MVYPFVQTECRFPFPIIMKLFLPFASRFLLGEAQLNYVFSFTNLRNMHALDNSVSSELFDVYEIVMSGIR
jgi:hypothetical protein